MRTGELWAALRAFEEAIDLNPGNAVAWSDRAAAIEARGKAKEAPRCANEAPHLDPSLVPVHVNKGLALARDLDLEGDTDRGPDSSTDPCTAAAFDDSTDKILVPEIPDLIAVDAVLSALQLRRRRCNY